MRTENETAIQQQIYTWINNTYCLANHSPSLVVHSIPNGIGFNIPASVPKQFHAAIRNSIAMQIDLLKKSGMVSGISDLKIEGVVGRCVNMEVKTSTGDQRPDQIKIQKKVEALGGVYLLVRSLSDAQQQLLPFLPWLTNEKIQL